MSLSGDSGQVAASGTGQPFPPPPQASLWARPQRSGLAYLCLASFLALYFELVIIRYLSTEIRIFAYLKNLPLIASFFGIGIGMVLGAPPRLLQRVFPALAFFLFIPIVFAAPLHLTHISFPNADYQVYGVGWDRTLPMFAAMLQFLGITLGFLCMIVAFFTVLGGMVGERLAHHPPLVGYGVNLLGSLGGIVVFTLFSFYYLPPTIWLLAGLLPLCAFFRQRTAVAFFAALVLITAAPHPTTYWSPYYRIDFEKLQQPPQWLHPSAYLLSVNHDYHQKVVDLSPEFISNNPLTEPNHLAFPTYELPYRLVDKPSEVLVVGAGTGNDVAAALRHGATHVDAVEIDPVILRIGKLYHPERPYDSAKVAVYVDDARAFFKNAHKKYDLIVFGYLDTHTLLSSFSSIRLDNYVYTLESFREAKNLLKENGTLVLGIGIIHNFVAERFFATLHKAFDVAPHAYVSDYDGASMVFVEGEARRKAPLADLQEVGTKFLTKKDTLIATDHWPFMWLASRTIPVSILSVLVLFLYGAWITVHRLVSLRSFADRTYAHFFLLGAGFLLLETKGVTEMSLLFGSTWITNALVIGAFLLMGLLSNLLVSYRPVSPRIAYAGLFLLLALSLWLPGSMLGIHATMAKVGVAGFFVGLPIFFTGLIFSRSFRRVANPSQALGINLFGAVIGGALENTVMIGGTLTLGLLAILIYGGSFIVCPVGERDGET